ncbi:hypothetical protein VSP10_04905 [Myroides odoratimimus]|nr:hypothetical protein [Myroides odoratimimus]MCS7472723.1 hypothetical protein [Myroides odoratimimus]MEC4052124.1 hypothetical protein [Myroides odoratimimus]
MKILNKEDNEMIESNYRVLKSLRSPFDKDKKLIDVYTYIVIGCIFNILYDSVKWKLPLKRSGFRYKKLL